MRSKLFISFALLVFCLLGWWLFRQKSNADAVLSIRGINEQSSLALSKPEGRLNNPVRKVINKAEGMQKAKIFWEGQTYPERLKVADIDLPIVFEGEVSEELKQVMLADIHMIYAHMKSYEIYDLHQEVFFRRYRSGSY